MAYEAQLNIYVVKVYGGLTSLMARAGDSGGLGGDTQVQRTLDAGARAIGLVDVARRLTAHRPHADLLVPPSFWPLDRREDEDAEAARRRAALALARSAVPHLERCRAGLAGLPPHARLALLPVALVPAYVTVLGNASDRVETVRRDINPLRRLWTLWRARHKKIMV